MGFYKFLRPSSSIYGGLCDIYLAVGFQPAAEM
jgi:hypothetical protein